MKLEEIGKNALNLCLSCNKRKEIVFKDNGWWSPLCKFWNPKKSTKEEQYGPTRKCPYFLEHTVLDNRCGFKICSGFIALNLIEFLSDNKDCGIRCFSQKKGDEVHENIVLVNGRLNNNKNVDFVIDWFNRMFKKEAFNNVSHLVKYDTILRKEDRFYVEKVEVFRNNSFQMEFNFER